MWPSRSSMAARICWMRRAFWSAMPPQRIASATSVAGASATCSHVGNLSLSRANARSELTSEVCWDRTVATSSSMTRSRCCTSVMPSGPGVVIGPILARGGRCWEAFRSPGGPRLDYQDSGAEADGQRPCHPRDGLGRIVRGDRKQARGGFGVPDPDGAVVAGAGQQLLPGHGDRAHVADIGPVTFQGGALLAGFGIPDPDGAAAARAGQQLLPGHGDRAHRPEDTAACEPGARLAGFG